MLSLNFTPFPELYTDRLVLRCVTLEDAPSIFKLRSDPVLLEFIDRAPLTSVEDARNFIETKLLPPLLANESIHWVISPKENPDTVIGISSFWRIEKEHYRAEIGYMIFQEYWRKGITREAVKKMIEWAFTETELHSIEAKINPANTASELLLLQLGFIKEAYHRENYFFDGVFKDTAIFSLLCPK